MRYSHALLSLLLVLLTWSYSAQARPTQTFVVTHPADANDGACDADCSLREAVIAANAAPGPDTIVVPPGQYDLTLYGAYDDDALTGDLDIRESVVISGSGAGATEVNAAQVYDRVWDILTGAVT